MRNNNESKEVGNAVRSKRGSEQMRSYAIDVGIIKEIYCRVTLRPTVLKSVQYGK